MIVFDLRCAGGHVFEACFGSSAGYEEQRAAGLIACPICGDADVTKAVMAPNVAAKGNSAPSTRAEAMKAAFAAITAMQAKALESSQWVGAGFAERARAMHNGLEAEGPIHGQATREDAVALVEEGIPVAPLLVPVVPPEALN